MGVMRIYVDESGNFLPGASSRFCCVVALAIPESSAQAVCGQYEALRSTWTSEPELKGSALSDDQTRDALALLGRYDVVAEIVAVDLGRHTEDDIRQFQQKQAEAIAGGLTSKHRDNAVRWANGLKDEWLALSAQLALQMQLLIFALENVVRFVPNYYAQRAPSELSRFDWILDPKDIKLTRFEEVWRRAVCPLLQTLSLRAPMARVEGLDYSALDRFHMKMPDYLRGHTTPSSDSDEDLGGLDLNLLFSESVSFPDSRGDAGLQLADIVASGFAKALNGKLPADVWRLFGNLLVQKPKGSVLSLVEK
jgi:hypothetical protein